MVISISEKLNVQFVHHNVLVVKKMLNIVLYVVTQELQELNQLVIVLMVLLIMKVHVQPVPTNV